MPRVAFSIGLAFAAAARLSAAQCTLRLLNEFNGNVQLLVGSAVVDTQAYHGYGSYISVQCAANQLVPFSIQSGANTVQLSMDTSSGQTAFSAFAYEFGAQLAGVATVDAAGVIPEQVMENGQYNIDMCNLRFANGATSTVQVAGVTSECHDCYHGDFQLPLAVGEVTPYIQVFCGECLSSTTCSYKGVAYSNSYICRRTIQCTSCR
jgi:hypothetical protein